LPIFRVGKKAVCNFAQTLRNPRKPHDICSICGYAQDMSARIFRIGRAFTGLGIFAVKPIKRGAYIATYRGPRNGGIVVVADRAIEAGEEITYSYGEEYLQYFIENGGCQCTACIRKRKLRRRRAARKAAETRRKRARQAKRLKLKRAAERASKRTSKRATTRAHNKSRVAKGQARRKPAAR
jgi:hypothetical protein